MVKYRVKTYTADGRLISEMLREGVEDFTGRKIELREIVLEPHLIWRVYNCQVCLAAEIELPRGAGRLVCYPDELPEELEEAAMRDIRNVGGGINISGQYPLSAESRELIQQKLGEEVRAWLYEELMKLGLEIVEVNSRRKEAQGC
ncbi:MAG: hypothetical protein QXT58_05420 [Archaeoglobaceae archaeon]